MTAWTERPVASRAGQTAVGGEAWRAEAHRLQEEALPSGRVVVSCSAPYGVGGLGRHLSEIVDALDRRRQPRRYICGSDRTGASAPKRRRLGGRALSAALALPPMRLAAARGMRRFNAEFDAYAAQRLGAADHAIAFNGAALAQFRAAREAGYESCSLVSATAHLRRVVRQHALAYKQYPLEGSWATRLLERNSSEYGLADRIFVASQYAWESFIEEGVAAEKLTRFPLTPDPRYRSAGAPRASSTFDVVYVGSLSVAKGVPLLIDAVVALPYPELRLILVGGWGSRGMRRFTQRACARDGRISVGAGDPFTHLRAARLYVHPSYSDGFGYAPAEALACGVPVLVSEDTGMRDLLRASANGIVLPTGDRRALSEAIGAAYRGEALHG